MLAPARVVAEWKDKGEIGGAEQMVFLDESGTHWTKINSLSFHRDYLSLFHRLALHQEYFPATGYELAGFADFPVDEDGYIPDTDYPGGFLPVLRQPHVVASKTKEPIRADVADFLDKAGFVPTRGKTVDYIAKDGGVLMEDLHGGNVFWAADPKGNTELSFIDPIFYLNVQTKLKRFAVESRDARNRDASVGNR